MEDRKKICSFLYAQIPSNVLTFFVFFLLKLTYLWLKYGQILILKARFSGLEENGSEDKSKCQEHFDVYKECKKKEVLQL